MSSRARSYANYQERFGSSLAQTKKTFTEYVFFPVSMFTSKYLKDQSQVFELCRATITQSVSLSPTVAQIRLPPMLEKSNFG